MTDDTVILNVASDDDYAPVETTEISLGTAVYEGSTVVKYLKNALVLTDTGSASDEILFIVVDVDGELLP